MELIFRGFQWKTLLIYLDDLIIFSSDVDEHIKRLDNVFQLLKEAGLKLKPSKCDLMKKDVLFLGHIVGADGIKPNPNLIESISQWAEPHNVKQVQQYLGVTNYYRRFIADFSSIAAPLSKLTKKTQEFLWTEECQQAFDQLKDALCHAPILSYPHPEGLFILDTDASDVGIGAVLSQVQDGLEKVIACGSNTLDQQQK